jgi:O-antigen ligase
MTTETTVTTETTRKPHPIRGLFGGLLLGIGVLILLVLFGAAAFTSWVPFLLILLGCIAVGVLLSIFGPSVRDERR